ncbi:hypothetical protein E2C01_054556 [Portunus trituberculatus]|uniref:Uncharacterized protein n=1 Tax=Portunus trituberculatus TaxID=210409 RepID=A0A5B7GSD0_PORTR|nr:hypothetical protein [Portunus trituberculatus]
MRFLRKGKYNVSVQADTRGGKSCILKIFLHFFFLQNSGSLCFLYFIQFVRLSSPSAPLPLPPYRHFHFYFFSCIFESPSSMHSHVLSHSLPCSGVEAEGGVRLFLRDQHHHHHHHRHRHCHHHHHHYHHHHHHYHHHHHHHHAMPPTLITKDTTAASLLHRHGQ